MIDNVPVAAARALGATRVIVVRLHAKWENVRMMRTVTRTADLVADPSVVLIQPEMEGMAQWRMTDVPRLIEEGAARRRRHWMLRPRATPHSAPLRSSWPSSRAAAEPRPHMRAYRARAKQKTP